MAWLQVVSRTVSDRAIYTALSSDTKITDSTILANDWCFETDTSDKYEYDGNSWVQVSTGGAGHVSPQSGAASIIPSSYDADLTMDGTAQGVALASDVKLGGGYIYVVNRGATTEAVRIAFGTSELDAEGNLNIAAAAATTGHYLPSITDSDGWVILGVPLLSTHYAIANAVASDVQVVSITQGI